MGCSTDFELQVWRLSTATTSDYSGRFYSKVGANRFNSTFRTSLRIVQRQIHNIAPHQRIEVAPGDVIGLQMFKSDQGHVEGCRVDRNFGVVTLNYINGTKTNEEVWYGCANNRIVGRGSLDIGFNGTLNRFKDTAPIISASVIRLNAHTTMQNHHTTSIHDVNVTFTASPTRTGREEESKMNTIIVVANAMAGILLITVSITILVVTCICFVIRRRAKTRMLTTANERVAQGERNTSYYSEDMVKNARDRNPVRIQRAQVAVQLNQEIQRDSNQATTLEHNSGQPDFGTNEIDSNVDSITTKGNEAYGKFTFPESGDYENDYYHEYDYI